MFVFWNAKFLKNIFNRIVKCNFPHSKKSFSILLKSCPEFIKEIEKANLLAVQKNCLTNVILIPTFSKPLIILAVLVNNEQVFFFISF